MLIYFFNTEPKRRPIEICAIKIAFYISKTGIYSNMEAFQVKNHTKQNLSLFKSLSKLCSKMQTYLYIYKWLVKGQSSQEEGMNSWHLELQKTNRWIFEPFDNKYVLSVLPSPNMELLLIAPY